MPAKSDSVLVKELANSSISLQKSNLELINSIESLTRNFEDYDKNLIKDTTESIQNLIQKIDNLINLFETASKHVGEVGAEDERIKMLTIKLESLLEQNKTIAKGLLMLEKYVRQKQEFEQPSLKPFDETSRKPF